MVVITTGSTSSLKDFERLVFAAQILVNPQRYVNTGNGCDDNWSYGSTAEPKTVSLPRSDWVLHCRGRVVTYAFQQKVRLWDETPALPFIERRRLTSIEVRYRHGVDRR
jgi:hypothetical protein